MTRCIVSFVITASHHCTASPHASLIASPNPTWHIVSTTTNCTPHMASHLDTLSISAVCDLLKTNGFDDDAVEVFRANKIDGGTLLELNSEDLKELGIVALGDRKKLEKVKNTKSSPPASSSSTRGTMASHKVRALNAYFRHFPSTPKRKILYLTP